jgi:hypothetical protein
MDSGHANRDETDVITAQIREMGVAGGMAVTP